jgi:predicted AAA+ superfamily ATPase
LELLQIDPYSLNKINYWRTTNQTEIDFIVTRGDSINAMEVKWEKSAIPKSFKTIRKHYPGIDARLLVKGDFLKLKNPLTFLSPSL